jgi:E3 ubiquitin-protein ligase SHPRH
MLAVLFPHMFEEIEYLIPETETAPMGVDDSRMTTASSSRNEGPRFLNANAVAGPSRLG